MKKSPICRCSFSGYTVTEIHPNCDIHSQSSNHPSKEQPNAARCKHGTLLGKCAFLMCEGFDIPIPGAASAQSCKHPACDCTVETGCLNGTIAEGHDSPLSIYDPQPDEIAQSADPRTLAEFTRATEIPTQSAARYNPLPVGVVIAADQSTVHEEVGVVREAKSVRVQSAGGLTHPQTDALLKKWQDYGFDTNGGVPYDEYVELVELCKSMESMALRSARASPPDRRGDDGRY